MLSLFARPVSAITNRLLTRLRNGVDLNLSREEFRYSRISFAQFGEDLAVTRWIDEWIPNIPRIYVDAGCFHPIQFSSTLLLHKRGWRGVNIDMFPSKIELFEALRPADYNAVAALSDHIQEVEVLEYEGGLTDSLRVRNSGGSDPGFVRSPIRRSTVMTTTLNEIIAGTEWKEERIGYLNIDCEGHDLEVLKGFDLICHQPSIITIEARDGSTSQTLDYLTSAGYLHKETLRWTYLFVRKVDLPHSGDCTPIVN
jgi:FkbM family methyltransferase